MTHSALRPARATVHSIDHFALNVPSLAEAQAFFHAFRLAVDAAGLVIRRQRGRSMFPESNGDRP